MILPSGRRKKTGVLLDGDAALSARGHLEKISPRRGWKAARRLVTDLCARPSSWLSGYAPIALLAVIAVVATLTGGWLAFDAARRRDEQTWQEQRLALARALDEARTRLGQSDPRDPRVWHMLERSAGLRGLVFASDLRTAPREMEPILDPGGRILGFVTWERGAATAHSLRLLVPATLGLVGASGICAAAAWRSLRRLRRRLAASEERARRAADEDRLTGLPNHAKTLELLDLALAERAERAVITLALIEIDSVAEVNARFGVLASDEIYAGIARRLRDALPESALCGRIGSNEFAVILSTEAGGDVYPSLRALLAAIARPYWIDTVIRIGAHAGFAQAPRHAATRGELTRRAELALRAAARKGPGSVVGYDPSLDTAFADQRFILRELPRALSAGELGLHYQPIVSTRTGRIVGVEALLRWHCAQRGFIPPSSFIPVAEQMGLMDALGAFVLRRALSEARRWPELYVAVNLSPLQVRDPSFVDLVRTSLVESGVDPARLMLEVTEGLLIDNPEEMLSRIEDLHALGVRIALDDFGSGYSNLGYLQRFPLDTLKIDKSFVAALDRTGSGGVIIQAIVALARALSLTVLVEGVETEEQRVLLRLAGCDEMQGFLFARPAPAETVDDLLARQDRGEGRIAPLAGR